MRLLAPPANPDVLLALKLSDEYLRRASSGLWCLSCGFWACEGHEEDCPVVAAYNQEFRKTEAAG